MFLFERGCRLTWYLSRGVAERFHSAARDGGSYKLWRRYTA